jgi:hypothetical protein
MAGGHAAPGRRVAVDALTQEQYPWLRKRIRMHVFVDSPELYEPLTRTRWCTCGLPKKNQVHAVRERTEDERRAEARRLGERPA